MDKPMLVSGNLCGRVLARPSKSMGHRSLICAALAEGDSWIENVGKNDDIRATMQCAQALKLAEFTEKKDGILVKGCPKGRIDRAVLNCLESGSTLRFYLPLSTLFAKQAVFCGQGRLLERPIQPLKDLMEQKGVAFREFCLSGSLRGGRFEIAGDVSSQFISGLLFALPLLNQDSRIILTTPLESRGYVDMTLQALNTADVRAKFVSDREIAVPGNQQYLPFETKVEGDYSHAAFFAVAGAIAGDVEIIGLSKESLQGDRAVFDILKEMGARIEEREDGFRVKRGPLKAIDIWAQQIPDIIPPLAVACAAAEGTSRILGAGRLRMKESDRLHAICCEMKKLGAKIEIEDDGLVICGGMPLRANRVDSHRDHRMAMSLAVAAALADGPVEIKGGGCVAKSAPEFWQEFRRLGGNAVEQQG